MSGVYLTNNDIVIGQVVRHWKLVPWQYWWLLIPSLTVFHELWKVYTVYWN